MPKNSQDRSVKFYFGDRKSYSRELQESKILHEKSTEYANRFTLTEFGGGDHKY